MVPEVPASRMREARCGASGSAGQARLLTVGHGTAARDELAGLLLGAGVELVVDMRSVPGSRRLPHVRHAELES